MRKAVIYCRVSSDKQVKEGHGLESQEKLCRDYAKQNEYTVVKVFYEEGVTGKMFDRPAIKKLFEYLSKYPKDKHIVIFDDIKRWARDTEIHFALKRAIKKLGHSVESPNFKFEDSPHGKFVETIFAASAELERSQNAIQVKNKMKARLEKGFYVFRSPPPGYKFSRKSINGKVLIKNEPIAMVYKEALESFECGLVNSPTEVRELIIRGFEKNNLNRTIALDTVLRLLKNIFITGHIKYEKWDIKLFKGQHEGIISLETYQNIQRKLHKKQNAPLRKDNSLDFPLRGFVLCSKCHKPMTAAWHTGRNKKYPHYFCRQPNCCLKNKNILKYRIETDFESLINEVSPNSDTLNLAKGIFLDIWKHKEQVEADNQKQIDIKIRQLEKRKQKLLDRVVKADHSDLIKIYEREITKIEEEKKSLNTNYLTKVYSDENFGTGYKIIFSVLKNPIRMWQSENYKDKRLLLEMFFDDKIKYDLETGFGTADLALLPRLLSTKTDDKNGFVEMLGVEPRCRKNR